MPICGTVSQISPPIRILVIAVLGLIAAWMLVLKPSAEEPAAPAPAPATAPGMTGLTNAVDRAKGAARAQEARDGKVQKATGEGDQAAAGGATAPAARTEAALATGRVLTLAPLADETTEGLPAGIRGALSRRQVFAVGVFNTRNKPWARMAADDRGVRRALSNANRYGGKVTVHAAALADLSRLRPVIGDLDVAQSPSVVVVDRNRRATVLEGYVDRISINQAITDARRNSTAFRIKNGYLSDLNRTCANYALRGERFWLPRSLKGLKGTTRRLDRLTATYLRRFGRLAPPARFKGLQSQIMSALRGDRRRALGALNAFNAGNRSRALQILGGFDLTAAIALDRRLDRTGVTSCVGFRRS